MPEVVVCLEADDDFLRIRIMNLPENVVAGTHNTEEGLKRRLEEYKIVNTEDETVLNFFDEVEIHPEKIGNVLNLMRIMIKSNTGQKTTHLFLIHPPNFSNLSLRLN